MTSAGVSMSAYGIPGVAGGNWAMWVFLVSVTLRSGHQRVGQRS